MTTVSFETKPLCECVALFQELDEKCFPPEMRLADVELEELIQTDAQCIVVRYNNFNIGLAIYISEDQAGTLLGEIDGEFIPHPTGVYSYSEAIDPAYQKLGLGIAMVNEVISRIRNEGATRLSAHVRTIQGWDRRRYAKLNITESRIVPDFWENPLEVVKFQAVKL